MPVDHQPCKQNVENSPEAGKPTVPDTLPESWAELMALFGGDAAFREVMGRAGEAVARATPAAWRVRGVPPGRWPQLVEALVLIGRSDIGFLYLQDLWRAANDSEAAA